MKSLDGRQGSSSSFRTPQRRTSSIPGNSTPQGEDSGPRRPGERAGDTGPILTFTASGHLPERPHFLFIFVTFPFAG